MSLTVPLTSALTGGGGTIAASSDPSSAGFNVLVNEMFQNKRDAVVNASVATTYYFSSSGNDTTGDGSLSTPWATVTKAKAILSAYITAETDTGIDFLFKRGDTFQGDPWNGLDSVNGYAGIGDYGDGEEPYFTAFDSTGLLDSDNAWTNDSGDLYYLTTEPDTIFGAIRLVGDPYNPFTRVDSSANCALLQHSWFQDEEAATFTTNFASDANALNATSHPLSDNDIVYLTTTGTLPTGLSALANYYVVNSTANAFELSLTQGGAPITLTGNGTGTHTFHHATRLYINAGSSQDPNDYDFEAVQNANDFQTGINLTADLTYIRNIRSEGWGVHPGVDISNTAYCVSTNVSGNQIAYFENVQAYYGGRHCVVRSTSLTGGWFLCDRCEWGYSSVDGTSIADYAQDGLNASIFMDCKWRFGKLPSTIYTDNYGAVYSGGPSSSMLVTHTSAGGANDIASCWVIGAVLEDNTDLYDRCTYEVGTLSADNTPGTAYDIPSYKVVINLAPLERLKFRAPFNCTVNTTSDTVIKQNHGLQNGDLFRLSTTGTQPGGLAAGEWWVVANRTDDNFQACNRSSSFVAIPGTDVVDTANQYTPANGDRVMVRALYGQLPGGLSESTLYYVVQASGTSCKLSLTSGGAAVDITDAGFGRFIIFGALRDITSTGSGTHSIEAIDTVNSRFVMPTQGNLLLTQNIKMSGMLNTIAGNSNNCVHINGAWQLINVDNNSGCGFSGGGRMYSCHLEIGGRQNLAVLVQADANAQLHNTVIVTLKAASLTTGSLNVTNDADHLNNNALYDTTGELAALMSNDANLVTLTRRPEWGARPTPSSELYKAGAASSGGVNVGYDQNWDQRSSTPSIGPLEA